jgi:hypothetical protein
MAFHYSPKTVTDGLVLCVDAANRKSYAGHGTTINDLSGNGRNGVLTNGPTFSTTNAGTISFDGTNDKIILNDTLATAFTTLYWTTDIWFKINDGYAGYDVMLGNGYPFQLYFHAGKIKAYLSSNAPSAAYFLSGMTSTQTLSVDTWYNLIFVRSNTAYYYYINGALDKTSSSNTSVMAVGQNLQIGNLWTNNDTYAWDGDISNVKIYNKSLSPIEVLQNYNATKNRFI